MPRAPPIREHFFRKDGGKKLVSQVNRVTRDNALLASSYSISHYADRWSTVRIFLSSSRFFLPFVFVVNLLFVWMPPCWKIRSISRIRENISSKGQGNAIILLLFRECRRRSRCCSRRKCENRYENKTNAAALLKETNRDAQAVEKNYAPNFRPLSVPLYRSLC